MNYGRLILRNLWHFRSQWLAVTAGVMIAVTVITGALTVGDSVSYSLRQLVTKRLGQTRYALESRDLFFNRVLADSIRERTGLATTALIQGSGIAVNPGRDLRISQVRVIGIDMDFSRVWDGDSPVPGDDSAVVSENVAARLELKRGDNLLIRVRKQGNTPAGAPFSAEREETVSLRLTVSAVITDDQGGRFSLRNSQAAPFNIIVSRKQLSATLGMPGKANVILVSGKQGHAGEEKRLGEAVRDCWQPEDAGVNIDPVRVVHPDGVHHPDGVPFQVTSSRIFFDDATAAAIRETAPGSMPLLTWLVNDLSAKGRSTPYSFVTAAGKEYLGRDLGPREILVTRWLADDLGIGPGDSVTLRYFVIGSLRTLREENARFSVKEVLPEKNGLADPQLMPAFPGMTDAGNCRDWETGAPVDLKRVRDKDEQYWKDYRGTPKAFISLETGRKLWNNRFGRTTAFRLDAGSVTIGRIRSGLMNRLDPARVGLTFRDVRAEGTAAAANATDFGGLFLSLGFFILAGAALLIALLFALLAASRAQETALLSALGFRRCQVMRILFTEAMLSAVAGAIPGILLGILYNRVLILGLNTLWNDAVPAASIVMHARPLSLAIGAIGGILVSLAAMLIVLWKNIRVAVAPSLIKNYGLKITGSSARIPHPVSFFVPALLLLLYLLLSRRLMNVPLFLLDGGLFLLSFLFLLRWKMGNKVGKVEKGEMMEFGSLVWKNIALNRGRSMTVVALLALGTFVVVITGANRKTFYGEEQSRSAGTGGFTLWCETTVPVLNDLNTPEGRKKYGLQDEPLLRGMRFIQPVRIEGDDASCLNLNQVARPGLLGVPAAYFDSVRAFRFARLPAGSEDHPWKALEAPLAPGVLRGFADATVIEWGLRKKIGDTLEYRDGAGNPLNVVLAGSLDNSIFQGSVLVSGRLLRQYFPLAGGSGIVLADGPATHPDSLARRMEHLFRDQGMMAVPAGQRLAAFNAVENTYLSVFVMLGGLGVVIGTIGLGIVLLRNIRQRRQEFALLSALGFTPIFILRMIVVEHLFLLLAGLTIGLISAFAGILPSLLTPGYTLPAGFLAAVIGVIFLNGLLWIVIPARMTLRKDTMDGLREE